MKIKRISAKKILNSKEKPAIELTVSTTNGKFKASAPAGVSRGIKEVQYFPSNSVDKAVEIVKKNFNNWLKKITISNIHDFEKLETKLKEHDKSDNWKNIGGNTVIALEFALLRALSKGEPWKYLNPDAYSVPTPLGNCIGGGSHAKNQLSTDFQEYLLIPQAETFTDCMFANNYAYQKLQTVLKKFDPNFKSTIDDESAWITSMSNTKTLKILQKTLEKVSNELGFQIKIGVDVAASEYWTGKFYHYKNPERKITKEKQLDFMERVSKRFDIFYLEDPLQQKDFDGFAKLRKSTKSIICGDDLTVSHVSLLKKAIKKESINAILVKPNQVGSLYETINLVELAKTKGIMPIISHRGNETMDSMIADLAVGLELPYIKCGIKGKERIAKLKRLQEIEKKIQD